MLQSRWEGLLNKSVRLRFRGGHAIKGTLKQDAKGYVLVESTGYDTFAHYFEPDEVAVVSERDVNHNSSQSYGDRMLMRLERKEGGLVE